MKAPADIGASVVGANAADRVPRAAGAEESALSDKSAFETFLPHALEMALIDKTAASAASQSPSVGDAAGGGAQHEASVAALPNPSPGPVTTAQAGDSNQIEDRPAKLDGNGEPRSPMPSDIEPALAAPEVLAMVPAVLPEPFSIAQGVANAVHENRQSGGAAGRRGLATVRPASIQVDSPASGLTTARIELRHPDYGAIKLTLSIHGGEVEVLALTRSGPATAALRAFESGLRSALSEQGVILRNLKVRNEARSAPKKPSTHRFIERKA